MVTPLGEVFLNDDEPDSEPQPGDDELGRALVAQWGNQIVARCADVRGLFKGLMT